MYSLTQLTSELNKILKNNKKQLYIKVNCNKYISNILNILISHGYINGYQIVQNTIYIFPKYYKGELAFHYIKRYSKPSLRKYVKSNDLSSTTYGTYILSTSKGILPHTVAKRMKIGGELLMYII